MLNLTEMSKFCHLQAVGKGFYEDLEVGEKKNIGLLLMLLVSEAGEALEAYRKGKFADIPSLAKAVSDEHDAEALSVVFENTVKDTFEDELADVAIRLFDLCGHYEVDLENHVLAKLEYNSTRPHKHGKEF